MLAEQCYECHSAEKKQKGNLLLGAPDPRAGARVLSKIDQLLGDAKKHWSFQPLSKASAPLVNDAAWLRNDIDRFILAGLEAKGMRPSAEDERRTLIRRGGIAITSSAARARRR